MAIFHDVTPWRSSTMLLHGGLPWSDIMVFYAVWLIEAQIASDWIRNLLFLILTAVRFGRIVIIKRISIVIGL